MPLLPETAFVVGFRPDPGSVREAQIEARENPSEGCESRACQLRRNSSDDGSRWLLGEQVEVDGARGPRGR